jgi:hypothetical protein
LGSPEVAKFTQYDDTWSASRRSASVQGTLVCVPFGQLKA